MKELLKYCLILLPVISSNNIYSSDLTPSNLTAPDEVIEPLSLKELENRIRINDEKLYDRYQNAKPLYRDKENNILHFVKDEVDLRKLRNISYIWKPRLSAQVKKYEEILTIETYHAYNSPSLFKPSIDEVLAQIPPQLLGQKIFFEIVLPGEGQVDHQKYMHHGFHCAETTFYRLKD